MKPGRRRFGDRHVDRHRLGAGGHGNGARLAGPPDAATEAGVVDSRRCLGMEPQSGWVDAVTAGDIDDHIGGHHAVHAYRRVGSQSDHRVGRPGRAGKVVEVRRRWHRLVARPCRQVAVTDRVDRGEVDHRGATAVGHDPGHIDAQDVCTRQPRTEAGIHGPDGRARGYEAEWVGRCRQPGCRQPRGCREFEQAGLVERGIVQGQRVHLPRIVGYRHDEVSGVGSPWQQVCAVGVGPSVGGAGRHGHGFHRGPRPLGGRSGIDVQRAAVPVVGLDHRDPHPVDQPRLHRIGRAVRRCADGNGGGTAGDPVRTVPIRRLQVEPSPWNSGDEHLRWRR